LGRFAIRGFGVKSVFVFNFLAVICNSLYFRRRRNKIAEHEMNNKKSKEIRKQARKQTKQLVEGRVQDIIWKSQRDRDILFLIAIVEGVVIITLAVLRYFW
jgi:hypothetical protein